MSRTGIFAAFAIVLLVAQAFAAGPLLQVTKYETVPSDVYPGTHGYLQVTVQNSGDSTAQAVSASYTLQGISSSIAMGDIAQGSSSQISVPFIVDQSSAGSIQLANVAIYYSYASGSSTLPKATSLSIPLTVKQYKALDVQLKDTSIVTSPGDKITFNLGISNTGGVVNNLVIETPSDASFALYGSTRKKVGSIIQNSTVQVPLEMVSSSDAKTGTYAIPIVFTYQDALKQPNNETYYLGPITVLESSAKYRLSLVPLETVEIGSQVPFQLTLENAGATPMSGTIAINTTQVFTPIGVQTAYFDSVPAGQKKSQVINIGVSSSASSGYYTLPLMLTTAEGQKASYVSGVVVEATPQVTVTLDTSGASPQIQVANTGNSQIRSVHVLASAQGSSSPADSFIGTLNVDDFSSVSLPSGSPRSVSVLVSYKDSNNAEHTINQTLETGGNLSFAQTGFSRLANSASSNGSDSFQRGQTGGNPLGMLFGGRAGRSSQGSETNYVSIGVAAVAILAVGFFIYRHFRKGKKAAQQLPNQPPQHDERGKRK